MLVACYVGFGLVVLRWVGGGSYCVVNLIWWFCCLRWVGLHITCAVSLDVFCFFWFVFDCLAGY